MNGTYVGIVAYADDLLLLSPTFNGIQEMTKIYEGYGNTHNLTFSTDPILKKCKTHGLTRDLMEKRALYINKVNGLNEELYYAHPLTKVEINNKFNNHF